MQLIKDGRITIIMKFIYLTVRGLIQRSIDSNIPL